MLDLGWPELLVVALVLIIVVGPKDLPAMLRTFGRTTRKLRSMAGEFRSQFDEALKEAELDDVRSVINEAQSLNPKNILKDVVDPIAEVGNEIKSDLNKTKADIDKSMKEATAPASSDAIADQPDGKAVEESKAKAKPATAKKQAKTTPNGASKAKSATSTRSRRTPAKAPTSKAATKAAAPKAAAKAAAPKSATKPKTTRPASKVAGTKTAAKTGAAPKKPAASTTRRKPAAAKSAKSSGDAA